jgi:hypothetical protein
MNKKKRFLLALLLGVAAAGAWGQTGSMGAGVPMIAGFNGAMCSPLFANRGFPNCFTFGCNYDGGACGNLNSSDFQPQTTTYHYPYGMWCLQEAAVKPIHGGVINYGELVGIGLERGPQEYNADRYKFSRGVFVTHYGAHYGANYDFSVINGLDRQFPLSSNPHTNAPAPCSGNSGCLKRPDWEQYSLSNANLYDWNDPRNINTLRVYPAHFKGTASCTYSSCTETGNRHKTYMAVWVDRTEPNCVLTYDAGPFSNPRLRTFYGMYAGNERGDRGPKEIDALPGMAITFSKIWKVNKPGCYFTGLLYKKSTDENWQLKRGNGVSPGYPPGPNSSVWEYFPGLPGEIYYVVPLLYDPATALEYCLDWNIVKLRDCDKCWVYDDGAGTVELSCNNDAVSNNAANGFVIEPTSCPVNGQFDYTPYRVTDQGKSVELAMNKLLQKYKNPEQIRPACMQGGVGTHSVSGGLPQNTHAIKFCMPTKVVSASQCRYHYVIGKTSLNSFDLNKDLTTVVKNYGGGVVDYVVRQNQGGQLKDLYRVNLQSNMAYGPGTPSIQAFPYDPTHEFISSANTSGFVKRGTPIGSNISATIEKYEENGPPGTQQSNCRMYTVTGPNAKKYRVRICNPCNDNYLLNVDPSKINISFDLAVPKKIGESTGINASANQKVSISINDGAYNPCSNLASMQFASAIPVDDLPCTGTSSNRIAGGSADNVLNEEAATSLPGGVKAYPNPFGNSFVIEFGKLMGKGMAITITDVQGRVVYSRNYVAGGLFNPRQEVATSTWKPGMYVLTVRQADGSKSVTKLTKL